MTEGRCVEQEPVARHVAPHAVDLVERARLKRPDRGPERRGRPRRQRRVARAQTLGQPSEALAHAGGIEVGVGHVAHANVGREVLLGAAGHDLAGGQAIQLGLVNDALRALRRGELTR